MASSPPMDPTEALSDERIRAARHAVQCSPTDPSLRLNDTERDAIRQAIQRSTRPIAPFADRLLDMFDELTARARYGALDLFARILDNSQRDRSIDTDQKPTGVER